MFNRWLRRQNDDSDTDYEEGYESDEVSQKADELLYDTEDDDDDYYYYYYYEEEIEEEGEGPSIPIIAEESNDSETDVDDLYDESNQFYTESTFTSGTVIPAESEVPVDINVLDQSDILVLENEQLKAQINQLLIEKDGYLKEAAESKKIKEHNDLLSSKIEGYETILDDKQQLERRLLDSNHTNEENDLLKDENDQLKASLEEKTQQLSSIELEVKNKDEEILDFVNKLEVSNNELTQAQMLVEEHAKTIEELTVKLSEKETEVTELTKQIAIKDEDVLRLANESNEKDDEVQALQATLSEKETALAQLTEELEQAKETSDSLSVAIKELRESQTTDSRETVTNLEKQLAEKDDIIASNKVAIDTLTEENSQLFDKLKNVEEELSNSTVELLELKDIQRTLTELQDELRQSKELESKLSDNYEKEQNIAQVANEKREKMEQELTQMTENLENQLSKTEKLEKELAELRESQRIIDELEQEINGMRSQQARLTESLTDLSSEKNRAQELEEEVQRLRSEKTSPNVEILQEELRQTKEELRRAKAKSQQQMGMNQSDIAQVMIEAQAKAREIVETANQEAKRRIVDAESELSTISQEARNYYRKLETIKYESESVFSELLRKLEKIGDIDRI